MSEFESEFGELEQRARECLEERKFLFCDMAESCPILLLFSPDGLIEQTVKELEQTFYASLN